METFFSSEHIASLLALDQSTDLLIYALPFFTFSFFLESFIIYFTRRQEHDIKDSLASIAMGVGSSIINTFVKAIAFIVYLFLYQYRIFELENVWWVFILLFLADDLSFYMHHRACHQIRIFWAAHVNHHSSVNYNLAVALRQSWAELFHKYIWWLWMPILGFNPVYMMIMLLVSLIYQFFLHTELIKKMGILEYIMNTPSHHRVHHGSNFIYLDKNHGGILIIWDRLFGTFQKELPDIPVTYGITSNINTYNPFKIATHEYIALWKDIQAAPRWKDKINYLIQAPGWSHDKRSYTVKEMLKLGYIDFDKKIDDR